MKRLVVLAWTAAALAQRPAEPQPKVVEPGGPGQAPADAVVLFDGKDAARWALRDGSPIRCRVEAGELRCRTGDGDIYSRPKFGSAQIHLEFNIPSMPGQKGQLRGNSGVYLHGRYEIQILDSYQNATYPNGAAAALYGQAPPLVNASRPPGEWQTYDIIFHAPRCDDAGNLKARATLTVVHNGVLVQDHVEIQNTEKGCAGGIGEPGPLMLQDHSGFKDAPDTVMRFRNIWFRSLD